MLIRRRNSLPAAERRRKLAVLAPVNVPMMDSVARTA